MSDAPDAAAGTVTADPRRSALDGVVAAELRGRAARASAIVSLALPAPRARRSPQGVREQLGRCSRPLPRRRRARAAPAAGAARLPRLLPPRRPRPRRDRTPVEAAAIERLVHGGSSPAAARRRAHDRAGRDGRAVWALDARRGRRRRSGCALAGAGERARRRRDGARRCRAGQIVVADVAAPARAAVRRAVSDHRGASATHARLLLFAVPVDGVPRVHVDEALWRCAATLRRTALAVSTRARSRAHARAGHGQELAAVVVIAQSS